MGIKLAILVAAAKDMNKVMGLEPPIDLKLKGADLTERIQEEAEDVLPKDKLADETWDLIKKIGGKKAQKVVAKRQAKAASASDEESDSDSGKGSSGKSSKKKSGKKKNPPKNPPKKAEKKAEKAKSSNAPTGKKPGVIATIVECLEKKPCTHEQILAVLTKKFPDRNPDQMAATIKVQVPSRLRKDKGLKIDRDDKGRYAIK